MKKMRKEQFKYKLMKIFYREKIRNNIFKRYKRLKDYVEEFINKKGEKRIIFKNLFTKEKILKRYIKKLMEEKKKQLLKNQMKNKNN